MTEFTQVLVARASIYALVNNTQWAERGQGGNLMLYYYNSNKGDMLVRWWKGTNSLAYQLVPGKLKPKGDRSWVLRAYNMGFNPPIEEILAVRFSDTEPSETFRLHYTHTSQWVQQQQQQQQPQHQQQYQPQVPQRPPPRQAPPRQPQQQPVYRPLPNNPPPPRQPINQPRPQPINHRPLPNSPQNNNMKWACTKCTYVNSLSKRTCEICQQEKTEDAKLVDPSVKSKSWNCMACTLTNPINAEKCGICQTPKPSNHLMSLQKEKSQEWRCSICTLMNGITSQRCSACDTPKPMDHFSEISDVSYQNEIHNMRVDPNASYGNPWNKQQLPNPMEPPQRTNSRESLFDDYSDNPKRNKKVPNRFIQDYAKVIQLSGHNKLQASEIEFQRAASDIACYNDTPSPVFGTLRSVAKKLLKDEVRYRTLDTTNPKVMERLIGYEGVLDFLMLLGFEADAMGQKLVCAEKPPKEVVRNAIEVLDNWEEKLGRFRRGKAKNMSSVENKSDNPTGEDDNMTLQQIVLLCTHENIRDNETMETLIMCHNEFSNSLTLVKELRKRFFVSMPPNIKGNSKFEEEFCLKTMKPIQLNVIKNLRNWMKQYWDEDFKDSKEVQAELEEWIKKMCENAKIHSWNGLLADTVRNEFKRHRKYGTNRKNKIMDYSTVKVPRKFNINSLSPDELADQLTIMDFKIFSKIKPRECLGQSWKKKTNKARAPHILAMIQQFNNLTTFVQIQILREKSLRDRGKAMKRIIKMGEHFRELKNYNSLCAVFSALNSAPIHRLKYAWEKVPQKQKAMFDQFKVIFASGHNHRNLRQLFRNAAAPSIPHIGIFLQDLVFIDDGHDNKRILVNLDREMVNFSKCVRMADRIKNIQMYQQHPYTNIKENPIVQKILREEFEKLAEITEDQIWDMSTEIKKQDERDKNRYF